MDWFTGNIGYHHVHHLNPRIPFYRLPEAMAALPELQNPRVTTLHPRDIVACLRQNLWDPARQRMVTYREARIVLSAAEPLLPNGAATPSV
jgi:omega-6 fatty acid desaturase (delta-12 desaturase)